MKKALVVGLNRYNDNPLRFCNKDAEDICRLLETNEDGSPNFEIRKIIDGYNDIDVKFTVNASNLKSNIEELFSGDSDISLFYFSGHGSDHDGGCLCTTDDSYVRMEDLLRLANESRCKNKVIILDCCFSAKMGKSIFANNESVLGNGVTIMASSQDWQTSKESSDLENSLFTYLLIQGLKGESADIMGNITPASLYSFVDQSLGAWDQRPVFKTNISQFLPIRKIKAKVPRETLRKLKEYFKKPADNYKLDPSYEETNHPNDEHKLIEPYADRANVAILKDLQKLVSVGLVEPVDEEHMYNAAMNSKACRLTALGKHYWRLSNSSKI